MESYLSQERYDELVKELEKLRNEKRQEVADHLQRAKEYGDLSENAEYAEAREEQSRVEARIAELDELLKSAVIIKKKAEGITTNMVHIGSTVSMRRSDGTERVYTIVGSDESNPAENKISNESPIGRALVGKKIKDDVSVETPSGPITYTIINIS